MPTTAPRSFWRACLRLARGLRFLGLAALLVLVCGFIYLNEVGLPGFIKKPLLNNLRRQGLDAEFSRLRWRWYRGLVIENINLAGAAAPTGPQFFIAEAEVRLNLSALRQGRFSVDSLAIQQGRFSWLLPATSQLPEQLFEITDIRTDLAFLPRDEWRLRDLQAHCLGAELHLSGVLLHASDSQAWQTNRTSQPPPDIHLRLRQIMDIARQINCKTPPLLSVWVHGDTQDNSQWRADVRLTVPEAATPWGVAENMALTMRFDQRGTNQPYPFTRLDLSFGLVTNQWGCFSKAALSGVLCHQGSQVIPEQANWAVRLREADTPWGRLVNARGTLHWTTTATNQTLNTTLTLDVDRCYTPRIEAGPSQARITAQSPLLPSAILTAGQATLLAWTLGPWSAPSGSTPAKVESEFILTQLRAAGWSAQKARLTARAVPAERRIPAEDMRDWSFWTRIEPFALSWQGEVDQLQIGRLPIGNFSTRGRWQAPMLSLDSFESELCEGHLSGQAQVNVATREIQGKCQASLDWRQLGSGLSSQLPPWIQDWRWEQSPALEGRFALAIPSWTQPSPDWSSAVLSTLSLEGLLRSGPSSFQNVNLDKVVIQFCHTNKLFLLPNLDIQCPQGTAELAGFLDPRTGEYQASGRLRMDPAIAHPFLKESQKEGLQKAVRFSVPPQVTGRVVGNWRQPEPRGFVGHLAATNLEVRGQFFSAVEAEVEYSNRQFTATQARIRREEQAIHADRLSFNLDTQILSMTNVQAQFDAMVIARIIGPITTACLEPYHFAQTPRIRGNGHIKVTDSNLADLAFDVEGDDFEYWRFRLPHLRGTVKYQGHLTTITNLEGRFYQGGLTGHLVADDTPEVGTDVSFHFAVTNANFQSLLRDVDKTTNHLEGAMSGDITITRLNSADWKSWQGYGRARLDDGFIWEIPIFGIFSPVLNAVVPGMGSSKADQGSATFVITNSIISTKDLQIQASLVRMYYKGEVDFDGRAQARMEATLLRNTFFIGPIVSSLLIPVTKILEYKITGTLHQPNIELLYVPKILLMPLHPFQTLKQLLGLDKPVSPPPPANTVK